MMAADRPGINTTACWPMSRLPDSRDFGALMISMGMARAQRRYHYYRKIKYIDLEADAQREYQGLWALDGP